MTPLDDAYIAPPPARPARDLLRWVCTSNPFYVISAGLFLAGLWLSFGAQTREVDTWALMSGLAGYTLLLAAAALVLVRIARAWQDLRTVLLLVVLMFLATSVTFDELLALDPPRGSLFYLVGLLFAVVVSEGLLRGIRLRLPAGFRVPYYLVLALFFLYPLALSPLLGRPRSEELMWGLFGFAPAAGVIFLTLLPAIRRGPGYVRDNGSPWPWPYYPWSLFVFLAVAVIGRAFLLCWSMQLLDSDDRDRLIFGPYFLVPFGLAIAVLLLELGLAAGRRGVQWLALAIPVGLVALAAVGHRGDPIYRAFLELFAARLGGTPPYLTLLATSGFYLYAMLRRVSLSAEALTAALAALSIVGPTSPTFSELTSPRMEPIFAAAVLQLMRGVQLRDAWRCLLSTVALISVATPPASADMAPIVRGLIVFHLVLLAILIIGAAFHDAVGRALRAVGVVAALGACLVATFGGFELPADMPSWTAMLYPLALATLLAGYGLVFRYRPALWAAVVALAGWLAAALAREYLALREEVAGLDYIALSLLVFAVAMVISLGKAGALPRRLFPWSRVTATHAG